MVLDQDSYATGLEPDVPGRLDQVAALRDRVAVERLPGGITNRNYKVTTPAGVYVARLSDPETSLLAIDRDAEHVNTIAAAQAGVGAPVIDYIPDAGVLVVGFLEGRTFTADDVRDPANAPRMAAVCKALHSGPRFRGDFDMFHLQRRYLALVRERGYRLPDRYEDYAEHAAAMERAIRAHPVPTVPCNNDLLAGNIIDDGDRLWLIDYEYSGNNDPYFELGNLWSESNLPLPLLDELVSSYHGSPAPHLSARAWLWALMSKYGWTLWAAIQDGSSGIDFDFWTWGLEKYDRAVAEFESADFSRFLGEVAAGTA